MTDFMQKYKGLIITASIIVVAVLAYGLWWFSAAGTIKTQAVRWAEDRRAKGQGVGFQALEVSGFPFWLNLDVTGPSLATPNGGQPLIWQTNKISARMRPWNFSRVEVFAPGRHQLGRIVGDHRELYQADMQVLTANLGLEKGRLRSIQTVFQGMTIQPATGGGSISVAKGNIALADYRKDGMSGEDQSFALNAIFEGVDVPVAFQLPLGQQVRKLSLKGHLKGEIVGPLKPDNLVPWRDGGGTLEIEKIITDYGPLLATGEGTWALDKNLQPVGAMAMRLQGLFETVDLLRKQGLVDGQAALTAKIVLGVMAKKPADGGPAVLSVPVNVQDQKLYIGPVEVMTLPTVRW